MDKQMQEWIDRLIDGQRQGWIDRQIYGQIYLLMRKRDGIDRQDRYIDKIYEYQDHRQMDTTDRQMERKMDRWNRQIDGIDRQMEQIN